MHLLYPPEVLDAVRAGQRGVTSAERKQAVLTISTHTQDEGTQRIILDEPTRTVTEWRALEWELVKAAETTQDFWNDRATALEHIVQATARAHYDAELIVKSALPVGQIAYERLAREHLMTDPTFQRISVEDSLYLWREVTSGPLLEAVKGAQATKQNSALIKQVAETHRRTYL